MQSNVINRETTSWATILGEEKRKDYFQAILNFLSTERQQGKVIYPPSNELFSAFKETPYEKLKVVILGQDPYHGAKQAHGLSFSVNEGIRPPPSLVNIFKELHHDLAIPIPATGCLRPWAHQGVLLLNTSLSVEQGKPQSHANIGWAQFTDAVLQKLDDYPLPLVFLLWGAHAKNKGHFIHGQKHLVLTAAHPSPFSAHAGFLGCAHFSKTNDFLIAHGRDPIDWRLG